MTRRSFDFDGDARQRSTEQAAEDALHAMTTFLCRGCAEEHDIEDRVVLRAHPEMPALCWICATYPGVGGGRTYQ
ncbi:MAG: hypothetical protein WAP03_22555 [Methylorubrum rhodinum]|uniref:hypothetical protein n=1 Tax=Methylorubrum rhodinum TaxID=29428 RepID=UPI003BB1D044